jgi:Tfp pilus assembly protein PilV
MGGMEGTSEACIAQHRRRFGTRGESLIEVLITVSIVGLGVVAIITSAGSTFRLSGVSREESQADQMLVRYAENLIAVPYQACTSGPVPYNAAAISAIPSTNLPDGITVGAPGTVAARPDAFALSIQSVSYWNGDLSPATFSTTCPATDLGSQQLALLVHAGDGSLDRTMMIVKRTS